MERPDGWKGWPGRVRCPDCQETIEVAAGEREQIPLPCPHCQFLIRPVKSSFLYMLFEVIWEGGARSSAVLPASKGIWLVVLTLAIFVAFVLLTLLFP